MYTQQFIIDGIDDYGPLVEAEIHTDEDKFLVQKNINQYQHFRKVKLLIDTGSSISGLDKRIIQQLILPEYSELAEIDGAGGVFNLKRFKCVLYLKIFGNKGLPIDVIEGDYCNTIYDGIIGRDVLRYCFLEYDGPKEKYTLKAIEF